MPVLAAILRDDQLNFWIALTKGRGHSRDSCRFRRGTIDGDEKKTLYAVRQSAES
jgi:hypothetical protein